MKRSIEWQREYGMHRFCLVIKALVSYFERRFVRHHVSALKAEKHAEIDSLHLLNRAAI